MSVDLVDRMLVVISYSEVLCLTIATHLSDLAIKVIDRNFRFKSFQNSISLEHVD